MYKNKISVRVYLEGQRETAERNRITANFLKKNKIKVKFGATHAKGFLIDDKYVLFGSTNLTNQSLLKNNETNLCLQDEGVSRGFSKYFEHLWSGGTHGGVTLKLPLLADGAFLKPLIKLIDGAQKTLEFSIYFFDHQEIEHALKRAFIRGVKITGFVHTHKYFALNYVRRTSSTVARLKKAGIKNLYFGPPHLFTHSKYLIADGKVLILGTGNWLKEDVAVHPQLYIQLADPVVAAELGKVLKSQIKDAKSEPLS